MRSAQEEVLAKYPLAEVVRGTFGLVVSTRTEEGSLGDGRAWYVEEAWISAAEQLEHRGGG